MNTANKKKKERAYFIRLRILYTCIRHHKNKRKHTKKCEVTSTKMVSGKTFQQIIHYFSFKPGAMARWPQTGLLARFFITNTYKFYVQVEEVKQKGSICFFISYPLQPFRFHPTKLPRSSIRLTYSTNLSAILWYYFISRGQNFAQSL